MNDVQAGRTARRRVALAAARDARDHNLNIPRQPNFSFGRPRCCHERQLQWRAAPWLALGRAGTGMFASRGTRGRTVGFPADEFATAPPERRGEKRRCNPTTQWRPRRKIERTLSRVPPEPAIRRSVATRIMVMRVMARVRAIRKNAPPKLPRMSKSDRGGIRGMILGGGLVAVLALGALGYFFFDRDGGREVASAPQAASPEARMSLLRHPRRRRMSRAHHRRPNRRPHLHQPRPRSLRLRRPPQRRVHQRSQRRARPAR